MMDFSVRAATEADIPALCSLELECFSCPWSEESFSDSMRGGDTVFFIAEANGRALGYIGGVFVLDECTVTDVCTTERARRRGIARALIEALFGECGRRGAHGIFLEVRESNSAAVSLYERLGFARVGKRVGAYQKPREDAYIYKKTL